MYKKIITVSFFIGIFYPLIALAQDTAAVKQLSPFTSVDITKRGKVIITQGDANSVRTVPADQADKINAVISGSTLSIDAPSDVTVYVSMKEIEKLSVSGFGSIISESPLKSEDLRLTIGGSGRIELKNADVKKLTTDISGVGKVTVAGKAEATDINISGSGKVDASGLKTTTSDVNISGLGKSTVDASDNLNISISGSGSVEYVNPPKNLSKNISGMGRVREYRASGDTTSLRFGNKKITISDEDGDDEEKYYKHGKDKDKDWEHDWDQWGKKWEKWGDEWKNWGDHWSDKWDEKRKKKDEEDKRNKPSWPGIELGVNGYMDAGGSTTLPQGLDYLDLDYGKSISLSLNFFDAHKAFFSRHLFLLTGLGLTWNNYRFNNNITLNPNSSTVLASNDSINYEKNKLAASYLVAPAMAEVFFGNRRYKSFHIGAGLMLGYKLGSHTKQKYEADGKTVKTKVYDDYNMNPFRASLRVSAGYGRVSVFAEQALTTFFRKDKGPVLYPFTAGIAVSSF